MKLKRYTNAELVPLLTEIFYDYITEEKNGSSDTYAADVYKEYEDKIALYENRLQMYEELLEAGDINKKSLVSEINYLKEGLSFLKNMNMSSQMETYKKTKSCNFSRSFLQIPLNKKINSFYDDFILEVVFYDDVCTPMGKYKEYSKLESKQDRLDFMKIHTQITHMGLVYAPRKTVIATISVIGDLDYENKQITEIGQTLLPPKFSDFENLTLADTSIIKNNDLKQFIQSKINLDKENMEQLASVNIRGDIYKIFKNQEGNNEVFYIRYVCRSTGRVYYNRLNLNNLAISKEFNRNNYESYAKAWWNLNTLGSSVEGKPVIRC